MKILAFVALSICTSFFVQAQLCTGSLGDPTVHITFGTGGNFGPPLPRSVSNLTYVAKDCPNDGEYTLVNSSFDCFTQAWHVVPSDHTPNDSRGYFMLINSSPSPGDIYVNTFSGLCANTTYEFAVWVMNVLKPTSCPGGGLDPNLTFKIETTSGTLLVTFNANDVAKTQSPGWRPLGLNFTTPPGITSVTCRIINNSAGGCGNDLALDDITLSACGPKVVSRIVANNLDFVTACVDSSTSFLLSSTVSAGFLNPVVQWQRSIDDGIAWMDISGASSADYQTPASITPGSVKYRMMIAEASNFSSPSCRIAGNPITINIRALPSVQATKYVSGCFGSDVALSANGGSTFQWTGPNGFTSNKQHIAATASASPNSLTLLSQRYTTTQPEVDFKRS